MTSWRDRAACRGLDPDLFHPTQGEAWDKMPVALAVCDTCPVQGPCLAEALARPRDEDFGIWGGTSFRQRAHLRVGRTPPDVNDHRIVVRRRSAAAALRGPS